MRERKKDIPILISHFIKLQNNKTSKRITGVSHSAMQILLDYNWPGNVRELENAIEHAFVLCEKEHIDMFDLPVEIRQMEYLINPPKLNASGEIKETLRKKMTRESLLEILEDSNWNKAEVARRVGVSRAAIWKYMKKWNIPTAKP